MQAGELSGDDAIMTTEGHASGHASQVWKIQHNIMPFMKKTDLEMVFYGNFISFYGNYVSLMDILCLDCPASPPPRTGRVRAMPFQIFRGRSGNRNVLRSDPRAGIG
jgi:hypothetical protein